MESFTAIAGWVADVPAALLAGLYHRLADSPAQPPSKSTIWRVVTGADAAAVDAVIAAWLVERAAAHDQAARDAVARGGTADCWP
jgi:hypothetical protein